MSIDQTTKLPSEWRAFAVWCFAPGHARFAILGKRIKMALSDRGRHHPEKPLTVEFGEAHLALFREADRQQQSDAP